MPLLLPRAGWLVAALIATASHAADNRAANSSATGKDTLVYVGTYTNGKSASRGIYAFRMHAPAAGASGSTLTPLGLVAEAADPAFLAVDVNRRRIFAVNEIDNFGGDKTGSVSSFAVNAGTGKLELINQVSSGGTGPCHLALAPDGRFLVIANYSGGTVAVVPVGETGRLGAPTTIIPHSGHSIDPDRQEAPHPHCVAFDPAGKFALVCDLGLDRVMPGRFDGRTGAFTPLESADANLKPGAGPRHLAFRPDGKFAYVVNELNATVTAFAYNDRSGQLTEIQTLSALPSDFIGKKSGAEIAVHPSGKWVYASNRGRDSIATFAIDAARGRLTYLGEENTGGKTPRHFGLAPGGRELIACNQDSNTLTLSRIDAATGRLMRSSEAIPAPTPVCVVFLPPANPR